jgi:hypothetical protein
MGTSPRQTLLPLQMSDFRGRRIVIVNRAVVVSYLRIDELIDIHAIQAIDPNCIEFAAQAGIFSPPEGADSAVPTKYMVDVVGLVINELCFTRGQAKGIRANDRPPESRHCAHQTIALEGAGTQVEICFEANGPTMTMPSIRLSHMRVIASPSHCVIDIELTP